MLQNVRFLSGQIVAIKATFMDLLFKSMSVTVLLTLMHFSWSVICEFLFLIKSLFVQSSSREKQVICIISPFWNTHYFLAACLAWEVINSRRKYDPYDEANIAKKNLRHLKQIRQTGIFSFADLKLGRLLWMSVNPVSTAHNWNSK